jgi:Fic family protein
MQIKFKPNFTITPKITGFLLRIEAAKEKILHLPMTPSVLASLRETARLYTTHYSTLIEGNRLQPDQIEEILKGEKHFAGRSREEREVKGYYRALREMEKWVQAELPMTETLVRTIHALVMSDGRRYAKPTPYRKEQNAIYDSFTKVLVYMPPEAKDVPSLMKSLVQWIIESRELPAPLIAAIAHYQFATIHPYYDGNGRTARLLTTFILHQGGYDLKGLYSLEEYYAQNLQAYYDAISIGPSHNYYRGRPEADITPWVEYFIQGMAIAFENVLERMLFAQQSGKIDQTDLLRMLDPKQRVVLELFSSFEMVSSHQIGQLFGFKPRTGAQLCKNWVEAGFLEIADYSNKARKYRLAKKYEVLLT